MFHPFKGEIIQLFGVVELQVNVLLTTIPLMEVFVNVATELEQTMVSGAIVKSAIGGTDVVIGSTVEIDEPHGFIACTRIK